MIDALKEDRINVAVVGLGWWGKVIVKTSRDQSEEQESPRL